MHSFLSCGVKLFVLKFMLLQFQSCNKSGMSEYPLNIAMTKVINKY